MVAIFQRYGGLGSPQAFSHGVAPAMATAAVLSVLAATAGLAQPASLRRSH